MVGILFRFLLGVCLFSGAFAVSFREGSCLSKFFRPAFYPSFSQQRYFVSPEKSIRSWFSKMFTVQCPDFGPFLLAEQGPLWEKCPKWCRATIFGVIYHHPSHPCQKILRKSASPGGCFQKYGKTPQIIHLFIGFSIIFTIHFGVPLFFGNIQVCFSSTKTRVI